MDEPTFWLRLEYRLCREFCGMPTKELRRLWCDGIEPMDFHLAGQAPNITGRIWLGIGRDHQEKWRFTLLLPKPVPSRDKIDWAALLPPDNLTKFIAVDWDQRHIEIDPAVAVPDLD